MNDGSDDDDDDIGSRKGFDDDDDELFENDGIKEASMRQSAMDESNADLFDSLKEEKDDDTPVKKPVGKRKLGAKPEVVKAPTTKRPKKLLSDSDDSPVKVKALFSR